MSNDEIRKNIGHATSYGYAKSTGRLPEGMTDDEYAELMADYVTVGQTAVAAKNAAVAAKDAAETAAGTATTKAAEAGQSATTATNAASAAQADADAAALDASQAMSAASTATTKAEEAATSAATATNAKDAAVTAKTAAQAAQTAAETAEDNAETSATAAAASAASVAGSAAQIQTNAEDISQLKSDLTDLIDPTLSTAGKAADAKKTGDELIDVKEDLQLNFDDMRTTNRVFDSLSETVSGSGSYVFREIPLDGSQGVYYGSIQSSEGGTAGNFAAYLAAFDSNNNRLAQVVFPTEYPATCYLSAPANTAVIKLRLFATLGTSESNKNVTFNDIHVLKGSENVDITLKENVKIPSVVNLEHSIYGESISATKTFTGAGETNLDITTSIETGKSYYLDLENTNVTGHVQIYGYNGPYTSLIHLTLQGNNKYAFEATADYSKIRCHYIISSVGNSPSSKVTIKTRPIYEGNDNNIIHVGADCEYTSIQDAIDVCTDSVDKPFIIFIHNGEYSEFSTYDNDQRVRYISFIGESRCGVIVRGNKGTYAKPTAEISSNGAVRNITFIQETSAETQETGGAYPYCYALHDDYFGADTEYENCTFISNAGPAVGMGLKENKSKAFRNCTFINNGDGTFGSIGLGAFFGHNEASDNKQNQELIIENCTAINENGINGLYLALVSTVTGATYKGVNVRNCGSFGNGQAAANCTLPLSYSYGNNVSSLNVP